MSRPTLSQMASFTVLVTFLAITMMVNYGSSKEFNSLKFGDDDERDSYDEMEHAMVNSRALPSDDLPSQEQEFKDNALDRENNKKRVHSATNDDARDDVAGLAGDSGAHSRPIIESVVHQDSAQDLTHADAHGHGLLGESAALTSDNDTSGSISCYQCNSFQNNGCEKNVTGRKEWLHPCPSKQGHPAVGCWVLTQKVEYTINNELAEHKRTFRQCAYIPPEPIHACIYRSGFGGDVNHCFCNTTGCNPANAIRSNPILAVLSTLAVVVLFFKASFLA